jgi:hypothetical protein
MPWKDQSVFVQREDALADGSEKQAHVSSPKIGSSDALLKESIPGKYLFISAYDTKANAARAMSRRVDDLELVISENNLLFVRNPFLDGWRIRELHTEQFPLHREILIEKLIAFVQTNFPLSLPVNEIGRSDVIEVRMRVKNIFYDKAASGHFFENSQTLVAWVDEHGFFSLFTAENLTVALKRSD